MSSQMHNNMFQNMQNEPGVNYYDLALGLRAK